MFTTQVCPQCQSDIDTALARCPICGNALTVPSAENQSPPTYPSYLAFVRKQRRRQIRKIANLTFATAAVAVVAANSLASEDGWWMLTVLPILAYAWLTIGDTVLSRGRTGFRLVLQILALSLLLVVLDIRTGWSGWSLAYIVPSLLIVALLAAAVTLGYRLRTRGPAGVFGFIVTLTIGAIALVPLCFTWVIPYPWLVIAAALLGLSLTLGMIIFFRKEFVQYLRSQWHF